MQSERSDIWDKCTVAGIVHAKVDEGKEDCCNAPGIYPRMPPRLLDLDNIMGPRTRQVVEGETFGGQGV